MKRVYQTIFSNINGNCYQACIASVLEMPIEKVPHFVEEYGNKFFQPMQAWLGQFNLMMLRFRYNDPSEGNQIYRAFAHIPEGVICIAYGDSWNWPGVHHAVVGTIERGWGSDSNGTESYYLV